MISHFILYVSSQNNSADFYRTVLNMVPNLDVPGMTEFKLSDSCTLGLMPEASIKRLLGSPLPDPTKANGVPRAELYLVVEDSAEYYSRALNSGAKPLSDLSLRDWGHTVAYCLDPDGHVLAFAEVNKRATAR